MFFAMETKKSSYVTPMAWHIFYLQIQIKKLSDITTEKVYNSVALISFGLNDS